MNRSTFLTLSLVLSISFVAVARGGEHSTTDITAREAQAQIEQDPKIVVIDIRTPEEFEQGHIAGAKNIDFLADDFREKLSKLDRKSTYLFHCKSGGRSTRSLPMWKELGFSKVLHLSSGIVGWKDADLPLKKSDAK